MEKEVRELTIDDKLDFDCYKQSVIDEEREMFEYLNR